jgi:hypothetical protein
LFVTQFCGESRTRIAFRDMNEVALPCVAEFTDDSLRPTTSGPTSPTRFLLKADRRVAHTP